MTADTPGTIAFLTHTGAPSGAELAFSRLAGSLEREGFRPLVLMTDAGTLSDVLDGERVPSMVVDSQFASREMTIGAAPLRLVSGAAAIVRTGWRVGGILREAGAVVVVAESTKALLMATVASRRARIPLVWHVHDRVTREYFGRVLSTVVRLIGLGASGYLANSIGTRRTLWTAGRPVAISYPGVDLDATRPRDEQRPPEKAQLLMIGRITEWKGQDLVLRALALARTSAPIRFVGGSHFSEEPYAQSLRLLTEELGIADRVTFTGHQADPFPEAAAADVVIHYSRVTEPFGQVIVEAMASGCAVIATSTGGPTEIITDGVDGLLVTPNRPEELAAAIDRLVDDRDLRVRLGEAARQRARAFTLAGGAAAAIDLLTTVAPQSAPARHRSADRSDS